MATGNVYYWIKIRQSLMTSDAVDFLMSQPDGANYVVLYQMLHLMTANTDGRLERTIGEVIIPYDVEKIQRDTKWFSADTIRVALCLYAKLGLIYQDIDGTLVMSNHREMVGSETDYAEQKRIQRAGKTPKALPEGVDNVHSDVHKIVHTEIRDKRLEIRDKSIDKTIDKDNSDLSISGEIDCCTDVQRCIDAWNALGLQKIIKLEPDSKRGIMLNKRIRDYGIDAVIRAIESVKDSDFLMGKTKGNFRVTFDWLVKPNNFPKVLEGNYLNQRKDLPHDGDAYKMAKYFAKRLTQRLPTLPEPTEETFQKWATVLQEMSEEGHEWEEIADVIDHTQESAFWAKQICDPYALKRKYANVLTDIERG